MIDSLSADQIPVHANGVVNAQESARRAMFDAASRVLQYHAAVLHHCQPVVHEPRESMASHAHVD